MTVPSAPVPTTIFLAGDVMTGRGVDQILPTPSKPELNEDYVKRATDYVAFAARVHGCTGRFTPRWRPHTSGVMPCPFSSR